jgi:glycosyltransferase involved in cell wall biosynthesis
MHSKHSRSLICVSHVAPWPATHGNEIRLQRLLLWLRQRNYRIILVLTQPHFDSEQEALIRSHVDRLEIASPQHPLLQYRSRRQKLKSLLRIPFTFLRRPASAQSGAMQEFADRICPPYVNTLVRRLAEQEPADVFLAYYAFTLQAFVGLPVATTLICDSIEVFSMDRFDESVNLIKPVLSFTAHEEKAMLLQSDVVLCIQANESEYLAGLLPGKSIATVGIDADLPLDPGLPSKASETIGIIGSDNPANREGLDLFLEHSWPAIRAQLPQARLCIAGKLGIALQTQLSDGFPEGVTTLGWIPDLALFYRDLRVIVNPVVRGTGLKIKSVEAMAHARPLVAYAVGLEGMAWSSDLPWIEVADPQAMALACIALLSDPGRCDAMSELARQYARQTLADEHVYAPLVKLLKCCYS